MCCGAYGEVCVEIHEARLDGFHFGVLYLLHEGAHLVAVGRDGGDGGLVDFLDVGIFALALEDGDEVVGQVALCEGYDVFLGESSDAVYTAYTLFPVDAVDERAFKHRCASAVILE